jgi:hypothetical protein
VITQQISMRTHLERKQVDDVLGGDDAWIGVDKTTSECGLGQAVWMCAFETMLTLLFSSL